MSSPPEPAFAPTDPEAATEIGRRVTELIAGYMDLQAEQRVTDPTPIAELRALFDEPLPRTPTPAADLLDRFEQDILPHCTVSTSPRYFGLLNPAPVPLGIFADALASALNQNQAAAHHSPSGSVVEETVIRWLGEATGYGADCWGHLTSGGTAANMTGVKLALHRAAPEVRTRGLLAAGRQFTLYASDQAHYSIERSADVLGLGQQAVRLIPAGADARLDPGDAARAIERDRAAGLEPLVLVGIAGTTAAGAIDPLPELADLAEREGLWFHIDAAYGGAMALCRTHPGRLAGIERADSITVDAHKWFSIPFVAGGVLFRDRNHALAAFRHAATYIPASEGSEVPPTEWYQEGLAGSRRFDALKVWMTLKHVGSDAYSDLVDRQMRLTEMTADRLALMPDIRIAVPPQTAIVTFRYEPAGLSARLAAATARERAGARDDESAQIGDELDTGTVQSILAERDELQQRLAALIQAEGRFWISAAPIPGGSALRLNVISHFTTEETIEEFLAYLPEAISRFPSNHSPR